MVMNNMIGGMILLALECKSMSGINRTTSQSYKSVSLFCCFV